MTVKFHNLVQGSPEWHAFRAEHNGASEASAMMGASPYMTRTQLLDQKATGIAREVDSATQARFNNGHIAEAAARAIWEQETGLELFPVTVTNTQLPGWSASLDGRTLDGSVIWEHKLWNEDKAAIVATGEIPLCDFWQVVHQLCVSESDECIYVVSDGTADKRVSCEYTLTAEDAQALAIGWKQFNADLETHVIAEPEQVHVVKPAGVLPALRIEVQGRVLASNIDQFRDAAKMIISGINTELNDDSDFAQAEADVKWCKEVEAKLDTKEQAVMAQTADIETVIDVIREVKEDARRVRLMLDKLVKDRKQAVKIEIALKAKDDIETHCRNLQASLPDGYILPLPSYSINDAMKGKKTVASLRDAASTEAARAKADATMLNASVVANAAVIDKAGSPHLFADKAQLALKQRDDLEAVISSRISAERERKTAEEEARKAQIKRDAEVATERERERIREEEQAKAQVAVKNHESQANPSPSAEQPNIPRPGLCGAITDALDLIVELGG